MVPNHGAEISVIWLVERNAIKLLLLIPSYGKKLWGPDKFQCHLTLVALFKIFRSLFFYIENRSMCREVTTIPWHLLSQICLRDTSPLE